jgi:hypothetical protein
VDRAKNGPKYKAHGSDASTRAEKATRQFLRFHLRGLLNEREHTPRISLPASPFTTAANGQKSSAALRVPPLPCIALGNLADPHARAPMARPFLLPLLLAVAAAAAAFSSLPGGAHAKSKLAKKSDDIVNGPLLTEKIKAKRTLIVGPDEEFKTVQSAIDTVPAGNSEWVIVHLRSGVYRHASI